MLFKIFKQNGRDIIINLYNIVSVKQDHATGKVIIYSTGQTELVDESFDEVKQMLGAGPKREVKGF